MAYIDMDLEPDTLLTNWGGNPVEQRQSDSIDDAIQMVEINADLLEARAVINQLISACRSGMTLHSGTPEPLQKEIREELWAAFERATSWRKKSEQNETVNREIQQYVSGRVASPLA